MEIEPDKEDVAHLDNEGEALPVELFGFLLEDCYVIEELIAGLHKVLKRKSITPRQIVGLGKLLHGLKRLPLATSGIDVSVSSNHRSSDGSFFYQSLRLSDDSFETMSGGAEYTPGVGSDSYTGFSFQVELGGYRDETSTTDLEDWITSFIASLCDEEEAFEVEDAAEDSAVDWEEVPVDNYWEQLERGQVFDLCPVKRWPWTCSSSPSLRWEVTQMTLLNRILKRYQRSIDRLRFGKQERVARFCMGRVLENGEEIKYQMRYHSEAIRRIQQATNTTEQ